MTVISTTYPFCLSYFDTLPEVLAYLTTIWRLCSIQLSHGRAFTKSKMNLFPKVTRLTALASTNLFVLAIRLVQFFFSGVVLGVMAYYIELQRDAGETPESPFIFTLAVSVFAILTQFIYCFSYQHRLYFLWDICIAIAILLSFFWLLNAVDDSLTCGWSSFNPFGSDRCAQTRSILIIQIVLAILWAITGLIQAYDVWRGKRILATKAEIEV